LRRAGAVFGLDAQVVLEQEVVQLQQVERVRLQVVHTTHLADQILVAVELAIQDAGHAVFGQIVEAVPVVRDAQLRRMREKLRALAA